MTSCFPKRYKQRMMRREFSQKVPTNQFSTCQTALTLINPSARRRMKSVFPLKVQTTHTTISHFQGLVWLPRRRAYTVSDFYTSHLLKFYFKDDNDFAMWRYKCDAHQPHCSPDSVLDTGPPRKFLNRNENISNEMSLSDTWKIGSGNSQFKFRSLKFSRI